MILAGGLGRGRARGPLVFWLWWERLTDALWRPRPVRPGGVLRCHPARYRGPERPLAGGGALRSGARVLVLHLDNLTVAGRAPHREAGGAPDGGPAAFWKLQALARDDLRALASGLEDGVVALYGVTLFHPLARRLGFQTAPLAATPGNRLLRFFLLGLLAIYHREGSRRAVLLTPDSWPHAVWMSRTALAARYGPGSRSAGRHARPGPHVRADGPEAGFAPGR